MRVLFKYQPADRILREIHAGIGKVAGSMDTKSIWRGENADICRVFSLESSASDTICTDSGRTVVGGKKLLIFEFSVSAGFCKSMGLDAGYGMGVYFIC